MALIFISPPVKIVKISWKMPWLPNGSSERYVINTRGTLCAWFRCLQSVKRTWATSDQIEMLTNTITHNGNVWRARFNATWIQCAHILKHPITTAWYKHLKKYPQWNFKFQTFLIFGIEQREIVVVFSKIVHFQFGKLVQWAESTLLSEFWIIFSISTKTVCGDGRRCSTISERWNHWTLKLVSPLENQIMHELNGSVWSWQVHRFGYPNNVCSFHSWLQFILCTSMQRSKWERHTSRVQLI